ncbi:MAG: hypothetical protein OXG49_14765 [Chloroflexi bacterium]|nr:hypothetical protein [Chloroflexota bacterium]
MAVQQETQEIEMPPHFGEWLVKATANLSQRKDEAWEELAETPPHAAAKSAQKSDTPIPITEMVTQFEGDVTRCEEYINTGIVGFVEFVRQAGLDDDVALKFDNWTVDLDLAQTFTMIEEQLAPHIKAQTAFLRSIAGDWHRRARAGEIMPDLPQELAERVSQLDACVKMLTRQVSKRENNELIARLLIRVGNHRPLTAAEKIRLSDAVRTKVKYRTEPPAHREDWYGDNVR